MRNTRAIAVIGWSAFVADIALIASGALLTRVTPAIPTELEASGVDVYSLSIATFATVGALVMTRQPANRFGWLVTGIALVHALGYFSAGVAAWSLYQEHGALPWGPYVAWLFGWTASLHYIPSVTFLLLLFPDGALPAPRWRPVVWLALLGMAGFIAGVATLPGPLVVFSNVTNPFGVEGPWPLALAGSAGVVLVIATVASASSLGVRFRRARGAERQQIKWFLYGGVLVAGSSVLMLLTGLPLTSATVLVSGALVILAACAGVAILRHRLYDIDLIINRTLVYGATSAAIAATFFAIIVALQALLRPLTAGSDLGVAVSTIVSFALFQPVRRRVQGAVDRRFNRSRYNAARALDAFADRVRNEVDLDALRAHVLRVVNRTVAPAHASLWLRSDFAKDDLATQRS